MEQPSTTFPPLKAPDRLRAMLGVIISGVIFLAVVSRQVLAPHDPLGCVSALTCQLGWWVIPICGCLAFVFAAMVSWISGAKLEEMGVFAVSLGMALAVLRYGDAAHLWSTIGQADDTLRRNLAGKMGFEAAGWVSVIALAYLGSQWVIIKMKLKPLVAVSPRSEYRVGAFTTLFMTIIAMLGLQLFSAGTELAPIQTGQVCLAVAASFYLAAFFGYQIAGARSPVWSYCAVGIVAIAGYAWTAIYSTPTFPGRDLAHLVHFAPTAFGRALPVQTVMIGTAAAIFGNWHQRQFTRHAIAEDSAY